MKWKLKKLMEDNKDTGYTLSKYMGMAYATFSKKLNGHTDFTRMEIYKIKEKYNLTAEQLNYIFFSDEE